MIMTKEYRAWLKRPQRRHLDDLAKQYGFTVKTDPQEGFGNSMVTITDPDGKPVSKGKGNSYRDVFHFIEAIKIIKKEQK